MRRVILLAILMIMALRAPMNAADTIRIEGKVSNSAGLVNGRKTVVVKLYTNNSTTQVWTETHSNVEFVNGFFRIELGNTTPFTDSMFNLTDSSFGITVDGEEVKSKIAFVPYAMKAKFADSATLEDGAVATAKLADNAVTTAKLADNSVTGAKLASPVSGTVTLSQSRTNLGHNTALAPTGDLLQINGSGTNGIGGAIAFGDQTEDLAYIEEKTAGKLFIKSTNTTSVASNQIRLEGADEFYAVRAINTSGKSQAGVMSLELASDDIGNENHYLGFHQKGQALIGAISGQKGDVFRPNRSGIKLESAGADYAEYLVRRKPEEKIEGGDIVGVFGGKITKRIRGANRVMVVSSMPVVLGNWLGKGTKDIANPVAFVGQVPVKVRGTVRVGDYIVANLKGDGTGYAVNPDELTASQMSRVVGQAWSGSRKRGVKMINVAITPLDGPFQVVEGLQEEVAELRKEIEAIKERLSRQQQKRRR